MNIISQRLREMREKKNYSQAGIAPAGMRQRTVSDWESGNIPQALVWIGEMAKRFGVSTDYLLGLTDDPRPVSTAHAQTHLTDKQIAALEILQNLSPEEEEFVTGLIRFVKDRNQPRIIE